MELEIEVMELEIKVAGLVVAEEWERESEGADRW